MTESPGQQIIEAIIAGTLCHSHCPQCGSHAVVTVWSSGAAEQLDALIAAHNTKENRTMPPKSNGQLAYEAYCAKCDWKAFNGDLLPQWDLVKPDIQEAWEAAGRAVLDTTVAIVDTPPAACPKPVLDGVPYHVYQTKKWRRDIDVIIQEIRKDEVLPNDLPPGARKSRERSLAITKLQEAVMWLGMDLKDQGTPNPYPESKNPQSAKIEPTADNLKL